MSFEVPETSTLFWADLAASINFKNGKIKKIDLWRSPKIRTSASIQQTNKSSTYHLTPSDNDLDDRPIPFTPSEPRNRGKYQPRRKHLHKGTAYGLGDWSAPGSNCCYNKWGDLQKAREELVKCGLNATV